jgi:transcriptional regulator with XRE-family HTH domain
VTTTPLQLRAWREHRALSQQDLAAAAGVARRTITAIEGGENAPRPSTVRKLAEALRTSPERLRRPPPS